MTLTLAQMLALLPDNTTGDITAQDLRDVVTALNGPAWMNHLARRSDTPHADDDEFDDGVLDAAWTTVTVSGSQTLTEARGVLSIKATGTITSTHCNALLKPYAIQTGEAVEVAFKAVCFTSHGIYFGPLITNGTSAGSNMAWAPYFRQTTDPLSYMYKPSGTALLNATGVTADGNSFNLTRDKLYVRLIYVSANTWQNSFSMDGVSWYDQTSTFTQTFTPSHIGIGWTFITGFSRSGMTVEYVRIVTV